jgi:hypothetical protein
MAEPRRLLEQLGSGLEREMLMLGSTERAPSAARQRLDGALLGAAPLACAVVPRPAAAATTAGGAGAPATAGIFASAAKWLAIGVFAGGTLSGAAIGATGTQSRPGPELQELPSISHQVANTLTGMKRERALEPAAAREPESRAQVPALRRPSGTVWIGAPALHQPSRDPNGAPRASTVERR